MKGLDGNVNKVALDQRPKETEALADAMPLLEHLKAFHQLSPGSDTLWHLSEARLLLKKEIGVEDADVLAATLFHSIYGPLTRFTGETVPLTERSRVEAVLGTKAERLAHAHCVMNRASFDEAVAAYAAGAETVEFDTRDPAVPRHSLSRSEFGQLMLVHFGDWLQQVEPYDFWGYRRLGYKNLARVLGGKCEEAYEAMMRRQPAERAAEELAEMHKGQEAAK